MYEKNEITHDWMPGNCFFQYSCSSNKESFCQLVGINYCFKTNSPHSSIEKCPASSRNCNANLEGEFSFLGTYSIFAGVQKLPIGKFTLRDDGSYTVIVNSDQESYGNGIYEYNVDSKSLVWKAGLFVSNKYTGVLQKTNNAKLRILLSKSTYAEKIDQTLYL